MIEYTLVRLYEQSNIRYDKWNNKNYKSVCQN